MGITTRARSAGLWVPIITPMTAAGAVDEASLRRLAHRLLQDGVDGLVALGTTGEPATLDAEERRLVVDICDAVCVEVAKPLLVGAGTNSTTSTIEEVRSLTERTSAVVGALVVVPYYTRPSEQAVVEHFMMVADESPVPLVMYNIPYRTGRGLDAAKLVAASTHDNIVGLKQSVGALDGDSLELLASIGPDFDVLAGDDAFIVPTILMGGSGAISAAAHLCTPMFVDMVRAAMSADVRTAVELAHALGPVVAAGFAEPSPAVWKAALTHTGHISSDYLRRPMVKASPAAVAAVLEAVETAQKQQKSAPLV